MLYQFAESELFNRMAGYYDECRPGYPAEIVDTVIQKARLAAGSKVLEIGCGSGKVTEQFIGRGFEMHCLDPGADLIKNCAEKCGDEEITFAVSRFEDYPLPPGYFDAVISGQAFHWVPQPAGYEKAAAALRDGGWLCLFWNIELLRDTAFDRELANILEKYNGFVSTMTEENYQKRTNAKVSEITESGFFTQPETVYAYFDKTYTADDYFCYLMTGNVFIQNPKNVKTACRKALQQLAAKNNGVIRRQYICELYMTNKSP